MATSALCSTAEPRPHPVTGQPMRTGGQRLVRRIVQFWRNFLFFNARHFPWLVALTRPFWMWAGWRFSPVIRNNTLANARRLLGENSTPAQRKALARAVIRNFYDFVLDMGRSLGQSRDRIAQRIDQIDGHDRYIAARRDAKGAIIVTAHMGSFEVGVAALLGLEKCVHVLFRRDSSDLFEKIRSDLRRQLGVVEECVDDGLEVWVRLREALARDEVVLIQGDRVMPGHKGVPAPFFGGKMMLPAGPAKLALATGAPIIPIFSIRKPNGKIRLFAEEAICPGEFAAEPDPTAAIVLRLGGVIERYVRNYPDQWLVFHQPWRQDACRRAATVD